MAAAIDLPVFMRLGRTGEECQVGSVEVPVSGDGTVSFDRAALVGLLRAAANQLEQGED